MNNLKLQRFFATEDTIFNDTFQKPGLRDIFGKKHNDSINQKNSLKTVSSGTCDTSGTNFSDNKFLAIFKESKLDVKSNKINQSDELWPLIKDNKIVIQPKKLTADFVNAMLDHSQKSSMTVPTDHDNEITHLSNSTYKGGIGDHKEFYIKQNEISSFTEEAKIDTFLKYGPLIGAVDVGTSSTRFLVFASKTAEVLTYHQVELPYIVPEEGWCEQDPLIIVEAVKKTIRVTCDNLEKLNINPGDIAAIGITNQRETTVLWDRFTGKPFYNAIVWMDMRTTTTVEEILGIGRGKNFLQNVCGLPVSTYFSALKIKWLMDNVPEVTKAIDEERCLFGTIDTWLIWNLTGGVDAGIHITDYTNASRTMLMNIETLKWDPYLCSVFQIPMTILPEIRSSSEIYAGIVMDSVLDGVPIAGILGDQQAALVGQMCLNSGQAKSTYGTGCFILCNTGHFKVISTHGLLTTVAYQFGPNAKPVYALEGSVAIAGIGIKWLRDNLNLINDLSEVTDTATSEGESGEVVFVPAFSGLYAPYWRTDARGIICGLTEETKPGHLAKAALEAVCFQVRDVLEAMTLDCGVPLNKLLVDGGMTVNDYFLQMQADYSGIPVVRPTMTESTSLGAAIAAGIAEGIGVWEIDKILPVPCDTFNPQIPEDLKDMKYSKWKRAIDRSLGWTSPDRTEELNLPRMVEWDDKKAEQRLMAALPVGLFIFGAAVLLVLSEVLQKRS